MTMDHVLKQSHALIEKIQALRDSQKQNEASLQIVLSEHDQTKQELASTDCARQDILGQLLAEQTAHAELRAKVAALTNLRRDLQMEQELEVSHLNENVKLVEATAAAAQKHVDEQNDARANYKDHRLAYEALTQQHFETKSRIRSANIAADAYQKQLQAERQNLERVTQDLEESREYANALQSAFDAEKASRRKVESEVAVLKASLIASSEQIRSVQESLRKEQPLLDSIKAQHETACVELGQMQPAISDAEKEIAVVKQEIADAQASIAKARQEKEDIVAKAREVQELLDKANQHVQSLVGLRSSQASLKV